MRRALFALAATLIATTGAVAQGAKVEACRLDADRIALRVTFMAGACTFGDPPVAGRASGDTLKVTVDTRETAEICTRQLVQLESVGVVKASAKITSVAVVVHNLDGTDGASATVPVAPQSNDCVEPGGEDTK